MSKQALLLVPGLMCNEVVWNPLMQGLSATHDCTVIDHGRADSLSVMAKNILRQAPERFAIAGHSMGGRVALEVYRQEPERVTKIALMNTGYLPRAQGDAGAKELKTRYDLLNLAMEQGVEAMAKKWVQGMVAPDRLQDLPFIQSITDMFKQKSVEIFKHQIAALLNRPDASPVLKTIGVPALVLCSEFDSWSPVSQHQEMAALMPSPPMWSEIRGAGHMCTMEDPAPVLKALSEWLLAA
jgi:pimeloyl-ACP methyl ester carboxylesterase